MKKKLYTASVFAALLATLMVFFPQAVTYAENKIRGSQIMDHTVTITQLNTTGVTGASYGDSTHYPTFTVGADGRLTAAASQTLNSLPSTAAKGDVLASNGSSYATLTPIGSDGTVLTADSTQTLGVKWAATGGGGSGKIAQVVNTETGAVSTGTTTIAFTDTIPTNTAGTQFMSLAITPTSSSDHLRIDVTAFLTATNTPWLVCAIFQDSTTNALATMATFNNLSTAGATVTFSHWIATAGTTSATTFKVRCGPSSSSTMTFNGQSGGRIFGGSAASSITITEIIP